MPEHPHPPDSQPQSTSFTDITNLACEAALAHSGHVPTLIVEGSQGPVIAQLPNLPPTHDERVGLMFSAGHFMGEGENVGSLRQVFFICEGWMSVGEGDGPPTMRPSQDPARVEVLLISGLSVKDGKSGLAIFEMMRDEDGKLIDLRETESPMSEDGGHVENPLLDAFLRGFWEGKRSLS